MICKSCGAINDNSKNSFCEKCGFPLKEEDVLVQSNSNFQNNVSNPNNSLTIPPIKSLPISGKSTKSQFFFTKRLVLVILFNYMEAALFIVISLYFFFIDIYLAVISLVLSLLYLFIIYFVTNGVNKARYLLILFTSIEILIFFNVSFFLSFLYIIEVYILAIDKETRTIFSQKIQLNIKSINKSSLVQNPNLEQLK